MVMDIVDGKLGRLAMTTTQFGVDFDSLADAVSFCVVPSFTIRRTSLDILDRSRRKTSSPGFCSSLADPLQNLLAATLKGSRWPSARLIPARGRRGARARCLEELSSPGARRA